MHLRAKNSTQIKGSIRHHGGWKNDQTVREYIEEGQLFDKNAAGKLLDAAFNGKEQRGILVG